MICLSRVAELCVRGRGATVGTRGLLLGLAITVQYLAGAIAS